MDSILHSEPNAVRPLTANEIAAVTGAANPVIVRLAAKLIIAGLDYLVKNGVDGRSVPRAEKETGNKV
jgi:hypothetical protein